MAKNKQNYLIRAGIHAKKEKGAISFQFSVPLLAVFADAHCQVGQTKNSQLL